MNILQAQWLLHFKLGALDEFEEFTVWLIISLGHPQWKGVNKFLIKIPKVMIIIILSEFSINKGQFH